MKFPTEKDLVSVWTWGIRVCMVLYGISCGRGFGFCMDLYGFAICFGECYIGPYEHLGSVWFCMEFPTEENLVSVWICMDLENSGLYCSVWNVVRKRILFLYRFREFGSAWFCMEFLAEENLVSVWIWGMRVCMVLYGISYGKGSGFCMDLDGFAIRFGEH